MKEIEKLKVSLSKSRRKKNTINIEHLIEDKKEFVIELINKFEKRLNAFYNKNDFYENHLKELGKNISLPNIPPPGTKNDPRIRAILDTTDLTSIIESFLSKRYSTPTHPIEIWIHLLSLLIFYCYLAKVVSPEMISKVDFVMAKLAHVTTIFIFSADKLGSKRDKIKSLEKGRDSKVLKKIDLVSHCFYQSNKIKRDMKLHRIANIIHDELKKQLRNNKSIDPPSSDRIKVYLKNDDLIWSHFQKTGRFWILIK